VLKSHAMCQPGPPCGIYLWTMNWHGTARSYVFHCSLVGRLQYIVISMNIIKIENKTSYSFAQSSRRLSTPPTQLQPAGFLRSLARAGFVHFISNFSSAQPLSSFPPHSRSADGKERHFSRRNCSHPANLGLFIAGPTLAAR
jgi:hypothetical protein